MIEVGAHLLSGKDRIALKSEMLNEAVIKKINGKDPEIFEAIILSGDETGTLNQHEGTAHGNTRLNNSQAQTYVYTRVRRKDVDELDKPDPFMATNRTTARKLVNMHPIGVLLVTPATAQRPKTGETWSCRYLSEDKKGIVLIDRVGVSSNFLSLKGKNSMYQSAASNWSVGSPQLLGSYQAPDLPSDIPIRGDAVSYQGTATPEDIVKAYPRAEPIIDLIISLADELGIPDPGWLANLINMESKFNPQAINKYCLKKRKGMLLKTNPGATTQEIRDYALNHCAVGLIQFMPSTADSIDTTSHLLYGMGARAQWKYVRKYMKRRKQIWNTELDVYMAIFFPAAQGNGRSYSIYNYYLRKDGKAKAERVKKANGGIMTAGDYYDKAIKNARLRSTS
jgi:hypothetical protein